MVGIFSLITGRAGPSGFGSASTAEKVTEGINGSNLTAIITGIFHFTSNLLLLLYDSKVQVMKVVQMQEEQVGLV